MTTSKSSEAVWNYKKYVWTTENWNGVKKITLSYFYIFAFCLTDKPKDKMLIE